MRLAVWRFEVAVHLARMKSQQRVLTPAEEFQMIAHQADPSIRTGSFWTATSDLPACSPLAEDLRVDVCIVGAGVVGMSIAYVLTRAGKSVVVLDDGPLGGGMTSMTTAHLTCVLDERYYDLERIHGEEGARLAAESHMTAINRIETIVAIEKLDCDFERLNGYLFLAPDDDEDVLDRELAAAQRAGIDATLVSRAPRPSLETGRCLLFPNQAQFHPSISSPASRAPFNATEDGSSP
jgi:glycine/D-amino acid oxidase-like deaminating enzyme